MSRSMQSVVWLKKTHRSPLPTGAAGFPSLAVQTSVPWSSTQAAGLPSVSQEGSVKVRDTIPSVRWY